MLSVHENWHVHCCMQKGLFLCIFLMKSFYDGWQQGLRGECEMLVVIKK